MGSDALENLWPCHETCRREKDKEDIKTIAKVKRIKKRNLGISTTKNPMPCGRRSRFKKKFGGKVVLRGNEEDAL
jgi:hypothetical protein